MVQKCTYSDVCTLSTHEIGRVHGAGAATCQVMTSTSESEAVCVLEGVACTHGHYKYMYKAM